MTARITISMPDDLEARINSQLDYGDNRSELIRELIERGLDDMERDTVEPQRPPTHKEHVSLGDDLPQAVAPEDARRVVSAVLNVIDAHGPLERKQIVAELDDEHSLEYDTENRDGAWWKRIVAPSLRANGCEHKAGRGWTR